MVNIDKTFWKGKKVFITGNTGFKGSWLGLWLSSMGAEVQGYSNRAYPNNIQSINDTCDTIVGDIRDFEKLNRSILGFEPEILFHLAAQPLVRESYKIPKETYDVNLMGTLNVYESVLALKSKCCVVSATTDKVYYNNEQVWGYKETDKLGGQDPYSNSKSCVELLSFCYQNSYFKDSVHKLFTARAGNVIGGGDWSNDRLIPDIIKSCYSNQPIELRNPHATRPWQFVTEPLAGYLSLIESYWDDSEHESNFNFGPNYEQCLSVNEVAKMVFKEFEMNLDSLVSHTIGTVLHESKLLFLDCTKAKHSVGWNPVFTTQESITKTCEWYKAFYLKEDIIDLSLAQILSYERKAGFH